jgi:hypothetical protein
MRIERPDAQPVVAKILALSWLSLDGGYRDCVIDV